MEIDQIIYLLKRYTISNNMKDGEIGEQDAAAASSGGGSTGGAYPTVTKWESGLARSVANQIDYKAKWKDLYKITRGKANTLL
jgi:hypothetical protein